MQRAILSLTVFFLAVHLFITLWAVLGPLAKLPVPPVAEDLRTLALVLFSLSHASYLLGWRRARFFFALSAGISWLFEQAGVATGAIYGAYHYSDRLGPKLGYVPLAIPLAWFMMIYPSYVIANLIADEQPTSHRGGLLWLVWLAFLSAMVMTAWDLAMDPIWSGEGWWVWEEGGAYFGVPIQNFAGWMLTTFTIYLLYRLWERRVGTRPLGPLPAPWIWMPLLAYGGQLLRTFQRPAMGLVACFAMGLPLLVAAGRASSRLRRSTQLQGAGR
jgi:putative membrane protein